MKVSELKKKLELYDDDLEIVIQLTPSGHVSGSDIMKINNIHQGFDWTEGKLILTPNIPVDVWYEKCKKCHIPGDYTRLSSKVSLTDLRVGKYCVKLFYDEKEIGSIPFTFKHENGKSIPDYGEFEFN